MMEPKKSTRLNWWPKHTLMFNDWTTMRHSLQYLEWNPLGWYWPLLLLRDGKYITWMWRGPSSMVIWRKRYIWNNLRGLLMILPYSANWGNHCMDSNKPQGHGTPRWILSSSLRSLKGENLIAMSTWRRMRGSFFYFYCMWITCSLPAALLLDWVASSLLLIKHSLWMN